MLVFYGISLILNTCFMAGDILVYLAPRTMQAVQLDKHVKLLDSPGIVMATGNTDASTILRNCVKVFTGSAVASSVSFMIVRCYFKIYGYEKETKLIY